MQSLYGMRRRLIRSSAGEANLAFSSSLIGMSTFA